MDSVNPRSRRSDTLLAIEPPAQRASVAHGSSFGQVLARCDPIDGLRQGTFNPTFNNAGRLHQEVRYAGNGFVPGSCELEFRLSGANARWRTAHRHLRPSWNWPPINLPRQGRIVDGNAIDQLSPAIPLEARDQALRKVLHPDGSLVSIAGFGESSSAFSPLNVAAFA